MVYSSAGGYNNVLVVQCGGMHRILWITQNKSQAGVTQIMELFDFARVTWNTLDNDKCSIRKIVKLLSSSLIPDNRQRLSQDQDEHNEAVLFLFC